jgi:hypothetical protein
MSGYAKSVVSPAHLGAGKWCLCSQKKIMQREPVTGSDISLGIANSVPGGSRESSDAAPSALALALAGCFTGGPSDLSCNPRHLDGLGKS